MVYLEKTSKIFCITENKIVSKEKEKLFKNLPKYKHPDFFIELNKFSNTNTGKISRTDLKKICEKNI